MTRGKNRDRREVDPANTTGKSIESIIVKSRRAWLASALSVVVNELDGEVKAHNGDECNQGQHLTLQHLISSIIAIICRGMYGLRGWILRKHAGNA